MSIWEKRNSAKCQVEFTHGTSHIFAVGARVLSVGEGW
jgi:hypothetical protein